MTAYNETALPVVSVGKRKAGHGQRETGLDVW